MSGRLPRLPGVVAVVGTADEGYLFTANISDVTVGTVQLIVGVNEVRVRQFVLPFRIIIRSLSIEVTTLDVGSSIGVGIYDAAGNRVVTSGAIDSATTGIKTVALATSVTLEPGIYFAAHTSDSTVVRANGYSVSSGLGNLLNAGSVEKSGTAANSASPAGVLPATLGVITATNINPLLAIFEP